MAFRLLVYHELDANTMALFKANGVEVVLGSEPTENGMCRDIVDCDAIILYEQPENGFNKRIIDAGKRLKLIARSGAGYETVDVKYAEEQGIYVTNTPRVNNVSVAEGTMMLMLGCNRNTQRTVERFRKERRNYPFFNSNEEDRGVELCGKVLGLIGCGSIGQSVAYIAAKGFQMHVIGYDPYITNLPDYIEKIDTMDELLANSDFVSLHLPSTESTKGSIGLDSFRKMKPSAYFINAARGNIVREAELIQALREKIIAGAGLDVYEQEPIAESSYELFDFKNVFLLPHCSAFTVEASIRGQESLNRSIIEAAQGKTPTCIVNAPKAPRLHQKDM